MLVQDKYYEDEDPKLHRILKDLKRRFNKRALSLFSFLKAALPCQKCHWKLLKVLLREWVWPFKSQFKECCRFSRCSLLLNLHYLEVHFLDYFPLLFVLPSKVIQLLNRFQPLELIALLRHLQRISKGKFHLFLQQKCIGYCCWDWKSLFRLDKYVQ